MTTHSSQVALDERYLSPDTGSRFARTPLQEGDPRWIGRYRLTARLGAGGMGVVYLGVARTAAWSRSKSSGPNWPTTPSSGPGSAARWPCWPGSGASASSG